MIFCNLSRLSSAYSRQVDQRFMKKTVKNLKIDMLLKGNRTKPKKLQTSKQSQRWKHPHIKCLLLKSKKRLFFLSHRPAVCLLIPFSLDITDFKGMLVQKKKIITYLEQSHRTQINKRIIKDWHKTEFYFEINVYSFMGNLCFTLLNNLFSPANMNFVMLYI